MLIPPLAKLTGSAFKNQSWTTRSGVTSRLADLPHDHLSNIYWAQRISNATLQKSGKIVDFDTLNSVVNLKNFILDKFGSIQPYLPVFEEEVRVLKSLGFVSNGDIKLNGVVIGVTAEKKIEPQQPNLPTITIPKGLTTDYNRFQLHPNNRKVVRAKLEELIGNIQAQNKLNDNPIVVNQYGQILDGQYRWMAAKELGLAFRVILAPEAQVSGATGSHTATSNFLSTAGITKADPLPGLKAEKVTHTSNLQMEASPEPNSVGRFLATAGIEKPGSPSAPVAFPDATPYAQAFIEGRAVLTWAALKLHMNIGDKEPLNTEGLEIIRNSLTQVFQETLNASK